MPNDAKDRIAELEKELYSKDFKPRSTDGILKRKEAPVSLEWNQEEDVTALLEDQARLDARHKKMKKFVKLSIAFFVVASIITGIIWWRGSNIISGENIAINVAAPVTVDGGSAFDTTFQITNSNKVAVQNASIRIEYPSGVYAADGTTVLSRYSQDIGTILPSQSTTEKVSTVFYGEPNTDKSVTVTLDYSLAGSNATLRKTTTYSVKILSAPVNIQLTMLKEVSSGQTIDLSIDVTSNSNTPINTLLVEAEYPSGFTFSSASPAPTYGNNTWLVSSLAPQEKRTIVVHGLIEGNENEEKIVKVSLGTQSSTDERFIDTVYNSTTESLTITKPFIAIDLALDNDHSLEHVVSPGRGVRADVFWQSNNPTQITDAVIEVTLKGNALNRYLIYASGGGFYRSSDNTIVWDKSTTPELAAINPGARGTVSFGFSPVALGANGGRDIKNPEIDLEVNVRARRASDINVPQDITTFASRTVKFETSLLLSAAGMYATGPFTNTGPLPPTADKETTYTIALSARNSSNDVSNASVTTTLPIYVKWLGAISPPGENVTYDQASNQVTWNIGRMPAGGSRSVDFQISFLPSLSQLRQTPSLTGPLVLSATDDFTNTQVQDTKNPITTYLLGDPSFAQNQAIVID